LTAQTLTVGGDINLNGAISILNTQPWSISNQITLTGNSSFTTNNADITFANRIIGPNHDLSVSTGSGTITLNSAGNSNAFLGSVALNSSGLTQLNGTFYAASIQTDTVNNGVGTIASSSALIHTTGIQLYREAFTFSNDIHLIGSLIDSRDLLNGGDKNIRITGNASLATLNTSGSYSQFGNLIAGTISVGADTNIDGVATIGTLNTSGNYVQNGPVTAESITVTGNATLTGNAALGRLNTSNSYSQLGNLIAGTISVGADTNIDGVATIGTLNTSGNYVQNGPVTAESITVTGNATLTGNAALGRLNTSNSYSQLGNLIAGTISVGADTNIDGVATIGTLNTSGNYVQNGPVTAESITVTGNATLTGHAIFGTLNVGGSYTQVGELSGNVMTVAGDYTQRDGSFNIQNATVVGNTNLTVSGYIGLLANNGALRLVGTLDANSINVGGNLTLHGVIRTTGDQIWTGSSEIVLIGNSSLLGNNLILARKTFSAPGSGNHNLSIEAVVDATIANDIGTAPGVNRAINATIDNNGLINELRVIAGNDINLFADVSTKNLQDFTANNINIGSVQNTLVHNQVNWDLSGTDGYSAFNPSYVKESNPDLVRTLISVDPKIRFNGAVNDVIDGTHSLVTIAIARSQNQDAEIIFESTIGAERKLYSVSARTIQYLEGALAPTDRGTIKVGGSIRTVADQRYQTNMFEVTGDAPITMASDGGVIRILTTAYSMRVGISLDYAFSNPPELSAGSGLIRLADVLRDVPSNDISAGVLSNKLLRMAVFKDETNDSVDAEVNVGDIEPSNNLKCDTNNDLSDCQFGF
jgi:hypothetical protein